jgi:nitrogen fixation/metabolism regulation signal transduction histidine kinase
MKKFKVGITIEADNTEVVQQVGNLIQNAVNKVEQADMIKLLTKVAKNPNIVKTALRYI